MNCCETCGQTLPEDIAPPIRLQRRQLAIYQRVARAGKHGVSVDTLLEHLYGDNEPLAGDKLLHTFVCLINRKIRKFGQDISICVMVPGRYVLRHPRPFHSLSERDKHKIIEAMQCHETCTALAARFNVGRTDVVNFLRPIKRLLANRQSRRRGERQSTSTRGSGASIRNPKQSDRGLFTLRTGRQAGS